MQNIRLVSKIGEYVFYFYCNKWKHNIAILLARFVLNLTIYIDDIVIFTYKNVIYMLSVIKTFIIHQQRLGKESLLSKNVQPLNKNNYIAIISTRFKSFNTQCLLIKQDNDTFSGFTQFTFKSIQFLLGLHRLLLTVFDVRFGCTLSNYLSCPYFNGIPRDDLL